MLERVVRRFFRNTKISYAQCGEDIIVDFVLGQLGVERPTYLDLGAHHPSYLSNTKLFYDRGSAGVCVEADPFLCEGIRKARPRDTCLNIGVGMADAAAADFYVMTTRTLNTFSRSEAERYQSYGNQKIEEVLSLPIVGVNRIVEESFGGRAPDFVSLDIEGLDLAIIKAFDFSRFRPRVFCIETLTYTENASEQKITELSEYMR